MAASFFLLTFLPRGGGKLKLRDAESLEGTNTVGFRAKVRERRQGEVQIGYSFLLLPF